MLGIIRIPPPFPKPQFGVENHLQWFKAGECLSRFVAVQSFAKNIRFVSQ